MSNNGFKNISDTSSRNSNSFGKTVAVPFISGILGASLVLGTCFGVPSIREQILGSQTGSTTSTETTTSSSSVNTDLISLSDYSDTAVYAAGKILPSIVGIEITYSVSLSQYYSMFGGQTSSTEATASGSGIIISEDGYIVTNNHVVDSSSDSDSSSTYYEISEATSIKVTLYGDDTQYDATIIGQDSQTDIAVIKIEKDGLTAAEFADSDSVQVGEFVMAVGNPLDLGATVTCGVVSAVDREVEDSDGNSYTCIQTDAAINSGNSGGALVNSQGQVIGINTLKVSSTGVEGIGFSIPISSVTDIIDQLVEYQTVKRPYIGISGRDLDADTASRYNLVEGVYVVSVEEYSAAEKAGLQVGDVIIEADGQSITTMDELNDIKNSHEIGDTMTLKIYRDGEEKTITLTLGEQSS